MKSPIQTLIAIAAIGLASACAHDEDRSARAERRTETAGDEARRAEADIERSTTDDDSEVVESEDVTVADQGNSDEDIAITQAIRSAVTRDDSLSMSARNVAIITRESVVTLRGNVNSADERMIVERHAANVEGVARIDNQLVVND